MKYPYTYRYVDDVIFSRRSIRAFRADPVSREILEDILSVARFAPSGFNTQPWRVLAIAGDIKSRLSSEIMSVHHSSEELEKYKDDYPYSPERWGPIYNQRRKELGLALYDRLNIDRSDLVRRQQQQCRNYLFFDAPVGLIFLLERNLGMGSFIDYGMFLQNIMLAARARGLDTCVQAAFIRFHGIIRRVLDISEEDLIVCGMSLGYADAEAPENKLHLKREPVSTTTRFLGW